jgi:ribonucleoside-diphosphate reductase beta chain
MSKFQYDLSNKSDYIGRKMFLDPAGGVTIQRFDEYAYPKIAEYEEKQRGFFWVPEEINLTKDKGDFNDASEASKFIFTSNLLRQTALDSIQGRGPAQIFTPVVSVPELEAFVLLWSMFETNIHSKSYSHIIRSIYNIPKKEFAKIHNNPEIVEMASGIGHYYDNLHVLNCRRELGLSVSEEDMIDAIWMALNASYALEGIRFSVSFSTSLAEYENKRYMGAGDIIQLILRDENLHKDVTAYLINKNVKDDERFARAKERNAAEVYHMYADVVKEEKTWAKYLFQKGSVIGLSEEIMSLFVDYNAANVLSEIGIKYQDKSPKHSPLPWYIKHVNLDKKQKALQESESADYMIGAMSSELNHDELPNI